MPQNPESDAAKIVVTFRDRYLADESERKLGSLESYQAMFPGYADKIAEEWEAIQTANVETQSIDTKANRISTNGTIGPYELIRKLGQGGQGVVYLAKDPRLGREVALKVLPSGLAPDASSRRRFHREAEAAARLDHPGICTIYDFGDDAGVAWIAMRYINGISLDEFIRRGQDGSQETSTENSKGSASDSMFVDFGDSEADDEAVTVATDPIVQPKQNVSDRQPNKKNTDEALRIIESCARILHAAHESGLIHRDIKPGNIMVDNDGNAILLDFGLARLEDGSGAGAGMTLSGDILGTPAYMSPEQIRARKSCIDRRTDVFSLGVTLYECITWRRPFSAPTRAKLYQDILNHDPIRPGRRNSAISQDLETVVSCALDKDPDRRYQTAFEMAEDLRRIQNNEPIAASPVSIWRRSRLWVKRNPVRAITALSTILLAVLSTSFAVSTADKNKELASSLESESRTLRRSRSRELASAAQQRVDVDGELALTLAIKAAEFHPGVEANSALQQALEHHRTIRKLAAETTFPKGHRERIYLAPSGNFAAISVNADFEANSSLSIVDLSTGQITFKAKFPNLWQVVFTPESDRVVLVTGALWGKAKISVLKLPSGETERELNTEQSLPLSVVKFSTNGKTLITAEGPEYAVAVNKTVCVWDFSSGKKVAILRRPSAVLGLSLIKDPEAANELLVAEEAGRVTKWNWLTGAEVSLIEENVDFSKCVRRKGSKHRPIVECQDPPAIFGPEDHSIWWHSTYLVKGVEIPSGRAMSTKTQHGRPVVFGKHLLITANYDCLTTNSRVWGDSIRILSPWSHTSVAFPRHLTASEEIETPFFLPNVYGSRSLSSAILDAPGSIDYIVDVAENGVLRVTTLLAQPIAKWRIAQDLRTASIDLKNRRVIALTREGKIICAELFPRGIKEVATDMARRLRAVSANAIVDLEWVEESSQGLFKTKGLMSRFNLESSRFEFDSMSRGTGGYRWSLSRDQSRLALNSRVYDKELEIKEKTICILDTESKEAIHVEKLPTDNQSPPMFRLSPSGEFLVYRACLEWFPIKDFVVVNLKAGSKSETIDNKMGIKHFDFACGESRLWVQGEALRVYDFPNCELICESEGVLKVIEGELAGVLAPADKDPLAQGHIRILNLRTGKVAQELGFPESFQQQHGEIHLLSLVSDGRFVASASRNGWIQVHAVASGNLVAEIQAHTGSVMSLALGNNGRQLVTSGQDGMIRLWSVAGAKLLQEFPFLGTDPIVSINTTEQTFSVVTTMSISRQFKGGCRIRTYSLNPLSKARTLHVRELSETEKERFELEEQ